MTEPIQRVGRTTGIGQHREHRDRLNQSYGDGTKREADPEDDQVDISEEARRRAEGRYKKNILEHIEEG